MYSSWPKHSRVTDWNKIQGTTHPTDLTYTIIRDYGVRRINIQNSSPSRPIGVAITPYLSGPTPPILFTLAAGEIKHLGINSQGGPPQYIWMLDLQTKKPVGAQTILKRSATDFVLRDGVTKWWVNSFYSSFSAAK